MKIVIQKIWPPTTNENYWQARLRLLEGDGNWASWPDYLSHWVQGKVSLTSLSQFTLPSIIVILSHTNHYTLWERLCWTLNLIGARHSTRECKGYKKVYYQFSESLSFSVKAKMHTERKKRKKSTSCLNKCYRNSKEEKNPSGCWDGTRKASQQQQSLSRVMKKKMQFKGTKIGILGKKKWSQRNVELWEGKKWNKIAWQFLNLN